jgi:hypothetical protein
MKIEELKVILSQDYGWGNLDGEKHKWFVDELIKDILSITKKLIEPCVCEEEDKHGYTEVKCCNECGKPTEDFWCK